MTPIRNITFNFSEAEDRVILSCSFADQPPLALLLTRRMAGPLLENLARMLVETSDVAATLPVRLREEVIMMEHAQALAKVAEQAAQAVAVTVPAERDGAAHHLLTRIDFQRQPERCTLLFFCNGSDASLAAITFTRAQLHWFVDTLDRFAQRADWAFKPLQRDWLALRDGVAADASAAALLH